jgi:glycosyltransferase involved in cell wall biosynthesis
MYNTFMAYAKYVDGAEHPLPLLVADVDQKNLDIVIERAGLQKYSKYIQLTGYIYNTDLPFIYAGASVFLYPSLRESFGIPVLESMACGTPVITSDTSALPEVAGDAAILVDPTDQGAITGAIFNSLNNGMLRESMIQKGLNRITNFSWDISAQNLLTIYQTV